MQMDRLCTLINNTVATMFGQGCKIAQGNARLNSEKSGFIRCQIYFLKATSKEQIDVLIQFCQK